MVDILHPLLFKRGTGGEVRFWQLQQWHEKYRSISGVQGTASPVESGWTTCTPKNVGKKNETDAVAQCSAEVKALYDKKLKRGFFRDIEDIDCSTIFKPMLAQKYKDKPTVFDGTTYYVQPKLDGIRCIARADGLWTRTGEGIVAVPHIFDALQPLFEDYPDAVIDGELYNHKFHDDFNAISSLVRKKTLTKEQLAETFEKMQYHIYDGGLDEDLELPFAVRFEFLEDYLTNELGVYSFKPQCLFPVDTYAVADKEELDSLYAEFMEGGYEGQIIRRNDGYQNTRSWSLVKRKEFDTAEFKLDRIEEGKGTWSGLAKKAFILLEDGREQGCGIKGNRDFAKKLLEEADEYAGGDVTVRFFGRTPDEGKLRFPVGIDFNKGARRD